MRPTALTILAAFLAAVPVVYLCQACPRAKSGNRPRDTSRIVEPVAPEISAIDRRSRVKTQLARRVIADRLSLLEAAELFRQANGEDGIQVVRSLPGRSLREKLCRQVIYFVEAVEGEMELEGHAPTGPRVSSGLWAELDRRVAAGEFPPEPEG